ncbi:hypothetical protein RJT34_30674 [Clitoria ternatea]|uniref:HTH myb-type domain-containing protein n=1 Tax=Clitoria ternatea TaxID=43366 RepID=A0AAN9EUY8_CLITE
MEELSLDLSLAFDPRTVSEKILSEFSLCKDGCQKMATLEDFVKRLEDEMRKIEAFKRELPLCMILVNHAITRLKEEINGGKRMKDEAMVEELMTLMKSNYEGNWSLILGKESSDQKNWMSSVQQMNTETKRRSEEDNETNKRGGTFLAINGHKCVSKRGDKEVSKVPTLSLVTPTFELNHRKCKSRCGGSDGSSLITPSVEIKSQSQNPRKQRRSWSPELHRRFVDALQRLGGPQVATPKQIRELMQVGGLTNDEVKSHLQKYRLHFRGPQGNSGLCTRAQECGDNKSKGNLSQSGSPQGPLCLGGSGKGLSSTDTQEDEKSDCHNWKDGHHHQLESDDVL